jgi:hypothetical protein
MKMKKIALLLMFALGAGGVLSLSFPDAAEARDWRDGRGSYGWDRGNAWGNRRNSWRNWDNNRDRNWNWNRSGWNRRDWNRGWNGDRRWNDRRWR